MITPEEQKQRTSTPYGLASFSVNAQLKGTRVQVQILRQGSLRTDLSSALTKHPSISDGQVEEGVMVLRAEIEVESRSVVTDISEICVKHKHTWMLTQLGGTNQT